MFIVQFPSWSESAISKHSRFIEIRESFEDGGTQSGDLDQLIAKGLVVKEKTLPDGLGRPKFAYFIPPSVRRQVCAALSDPSIEIVHLPFSRLKHLCRFEKGGYCKEARKNCNSETCPQIPRNRE